MPFIYEGTDLEGAYRLSACHPTVPFLLAAAKEDGSVIVLADDANDVAPQTIALPKNLQNHSPTELQWHPQKKWLALSWANGTVAVWSENERSLREGNVHTNPITCLHWGPYGTRLISGDQDGEVNVWKIDQRGRLAALCQYRLNGAVTRCLFCPMSNHDRDASFANKMPPVAFFLGTGTGRVFHADDMGHCSEHFTSAASLVPSTTPVVALLYFDLGNSLVVLFEDLALSQVQLEDGGAKAGGIVQVKLSAGTDKCNIRAIWVGLGLLALTTGGQILRIWDLLKDENETLAIPAAEDARINCIAYSHEKFVLAAGTDTGHIIMWKSRLVRDAKEEKRIRIWESLPRLNVAGNVESLHWGYSPTGSTLYARKRNAIRIFHEQSMNWAWAPFGRVGAVQMDKGRIAIWRDAVEHKDGNVITIYLESSSMTRVKSLAVSSDRLAVCTGLNVSTYEFGQDSTLPSNQLGSFPTTSPFVSIDSQSVFVPVANRIDVCNFQGTVKHSVSWPENEGEVTGVTTNASFLVVTTSNFYVKSYDISRKEPRLLVSRKIEEQTSLAPAKSNCTGTLLSYLAQTPANNKDGTSNGSELRLQVLDIEKDAFTEYDFAALHLHPLRHYWDTTDPRLLVCESEGAKKTASATPLQPLPTSIKGAQDNVNQRNATSRKPDAKGTEAADESADEVKVEVEIICLFWTPDQGILLQDRSTKSDESLDCLIGVCVPYFYFLKNTEIDADPSLSCVCAKPMRDFVGLEEGDANVTKAMMDFSYYLTTGNMDEAFKAVKLIKSDSIWANMARLCVKTGRVDVATVCLGNMGNVQAVQALRSASEEKEPEVRVAVIAVHLGMYDDAVRLYEACERYDLLSKLYQNLGQWEKALELAAQKDRINLRTTYYQFGKYLENCGDKIGAIAAYEKSGTYAFEVPRMLLSNEGGLEKYVENCQDKELRKWWAQYAESKGQYEVALKCYEIAQDFLSVVRVLCYCGDIQKAHEIAEKTRHPAAAYHLARQYENQQKIHESIMFYTKAKCFNHAIRLAKDYKMDNDLMHLALQGSPQLMMDVARYYEGTGVHYDRAVTLYHKGGHISKAVDLCFRTEHFNLLTNISDELGKETDPTLLRKCAAFFMKHGQYGKTVRLLITASELDKALEICLEKQIPITEDMAEGMSLEKTPENEAHEERRIQVLHKIADACLQQGSYHLACKKYTQAGDRLKAMKALLKSGDTQKIIFFAGVSGTKQREIFVIAANYLQTLDWRNDAEITKSIITFYTKAKAYDSLSGFFDACAQVEIDEYQNYEKSLGALKEALKCMNKAKNTTNKHAKVATLEHRIDLISRFVQARKLEKTDPNEMFKICQHLIQEPEIEAAVRIGDVYALMIETAYVQGMHDQALELLRKMRSKIGRSAPLEYYLDSQILLDLDPNAEKQTSAQEIGDEIVDDE